MQKPSLPKGTRDFGPEQSAKRKYIIDTIEANYQLFGFQKIETPAMENLSVLTGKYGEEGDQLLFKVLNSGDFLSKTSASDYEEGSWQLLPKIAEKGLRYDLTVPFARYVVMNQHNLSFPFKRYQVQPVWRADRPQKGRYREFYQCDADIIGSRDVWNEAELTYLIKKVFSDLRLEDYVIKLNHREILYGFVKLCGVEHKTTEFCVILDKLDKIGLENVKAQLLELGVNDEIQSILEIIVNKQGFTSQLETLRNMFSSEHPAIRDLEQFISFFPEVDDLNKVELDPGLARGLSYYTGFIYEVKPTSVEMGSIVGGGRYDDLTGIFGLPNVSGVGISFGLDRIYDVLEELSLFPDEKISGPLVLLTHFDEKSRTRCIAILHELRKNGIKADVYPEVVKLKKQLNHANKLEIPFVITIGDQELESENYPLKNMGSGEVNSLGIKEIIDHLTKQK